MTKTQAKRLALLIKTVEENEDRFNFRTWVGDDYKGNPDLSCGTTACALGWATAIPAFQKLGLGLIRDKSNDSSSWACRQWYPALTQKNGRKTKNLPKIGAILFGLTPRETRFLFFPNSGIGDSSITGRDWAYKARKYLIARFIEGKSPDYAMVVS